jgi:hypothetical protein
MKPKRKSNSFVASFNIVLLMVCLIIVSANISKAADVKKDTKILPDIVIKDFYIVPSVTPDGGDLSLVITAKLFNARKMSSTGPFKVAVHWMEPPSGEWHRVGVKRIRGLVNSPALIKQKIETVTFYHTIPAGATYKYRVTADCTNKVKEGVKGEQNNQQIKGYTND